MTAEPREPGYAHSVLRSWRHWLGYPLDEYHQKQAKLTYRLEFDAFYYPVSEYERPFPS